jgi:dihydropteroate synthase
MLNFTAQTASGHPTAVWRAGRFAWAVGADTRPLVMGIVNVTPDSFSDGGQHMTKELAIRHGESLIFEGADIVDVGGESTRPGAPEVSVETELSRVLPVIRALVASGHCVSIDSRKPEVMREAIAAGASIVNDVMALTAPGAVEVCADADVGVVLMHMQGQPGTMQAAPVYENVVAEVSDFLRQRALVCEAAGIARERIALDPGFGFGKTLEHNLLLTKALDRLVALGYPVLAGWSRKATLGKLTGRTVAAERVHASVAAALVCVERGARIVRVHDVAATVDALKVWRAMSL